MTDERPRLRIYGLRPYLRADGNATGATWKISKDCDARLSDVLERVLGLAMHSAEARKVHTLRESDLDRADLALRVAEQVSKKDPGIPRSNVAPGRHIPRSTADVRPNPRTADADSANLEDSS